MKAVLSLLIALIFIAQDASHAFSCRSRQCFGLSSRLSRSALYHSNDGWDDKSELREKRLAKEKEIRKRFATGEGLKKLRAVLSLLRENLKWSRVMEDDKIDEIQADIERSECRDPEIVYNKAHRQLWEADSDADPALLKKWTEEAALARSCLPRFNLEGLWVGK